MSIFTRALDSLLGLFKPAFELEVQSLTANKAANVANISGTGTVAAAQISALVQTSLAHSPVLGVFAGFIGSELTGVLIQQVGQGTNDASTLYDHALMWTTKEFALS